MPASSRLSALPPGSHQLAGPSPIGAGTILTMRVKSAVPDRSCERTAAASRPSPMSSVKPARGVAEGEVAVALTFTASARRLGMASAVGTVLRAPWCRIRCHARRRLIGAAVAAATDRRFVVLDSRDPDHRPEAVLAGQAGGGGIRVRGLTWRRRDGCHAARLASSVDLRQDTLPAIGRRCVGQPMQETHHDARQPDHHCS